MAKFSDNSQKELMTCRGELQKIFNEVIKYFDCTILEGVRSKEKQNEMYETGRSQVKWPNSNHNVTHPGALSKAVDVAPYPIDWNDRERFTYFAGYVKGIASGLGIKIRWGGDWDMDTQVKDNNFDDLVHFELVED